MIAGLFSGLSTVVIAILKRALTQAVFEKIGETIIIHLLEKLAESTTNKVDDEVIKTVVDAIKAGK